MRKSRKFFIFTCFMFVLSNVSLPVLAADVWYRGMVDPDSTDDPYQPASITLDARGLSHIAYTTGSNGLAYAVWNGSGWDTTTISPGSATFPSVVLDGNDRAHISYYRDELNNCALMYVAEDAFGGWQSPEVVDMDGGMYSSIVLDAGGSPHISYAGGTVPRPLKYARWNGTAWEMQLVTGASGVDTPTALALDGSGNPHIAYWDNNTYRIYYASSDGSSWDLSYVAWTNVWGGWPSLALDSSGDPHISFFIGSATGSSAVQYSTNSGSWVTRTVDYVNLTAGLSGGYHTSIALDSSGNPHISYYDGGDGDLKYSWYDGSGWQKLAVDTPGDVGYGSSLALDSVAYPHIGYYDVTNSSLKYAALGPEPAAGFTAVPKGGIAPVTVRFTDSSTNTTAWSWDFGDGAVSAQQHPEHTYAAGGLHSVSLTASSIFGSDTATQSDAIAIVQVSNFTANRTLGEVPLAVRFMDTTDGAVTAWNWTFGDGSTSTEQNPVHTYTTPGDFDVSLTTTSAAGSNTTTRVWYIGTGEAPVSDFTANITAGAVPLVVGFTDMSVNATAREWSFGDGTISDEQNPNHTYTEPGFYSVSLYTANAYGDDIVVLNGHIAASPGVTGISPASAMENTVLAVTLSGTGFAEGMTVSLDRVGQPAISAANVTVPAGNRITCTLDLTGASAGVWDVTVTNPDDQSTTLPGAFTVIAVLKPVGGGGGTAAEFDFVSGGPLLTSSEGKVLRTTTITAGDGIGELKIPRDTVAYDAGGNPITEITIITIDEVPETPAGAVFTFAGFAYGCTPVGATFAPAITLTFTLTPEVWEAIGGDLTVRFYNTETGKWESVPATCDPVMHTVTASVSHFTIFALFAEGATGTAPVVETMTVGNPPVTTETITAMPDGKESPESPLLFAPVFALSGMLMLARRK
jgi:PKD repeat protein